MRNSSESQFFHSKYNFENGDLVFVSSDNVCFRVHTLILEHASCIFANMIKCASPALNEDPLRLDEDSRILEVLLDFVYPTVSTDNERGSFSLPPLEDYETTWAITCAADKYQMHRVLAEARMCVMSSEALKSKPLELYALASRWNWIEVAKWASTKTLDSKVVCTKNMDVLRRIDSEYLCELLKLHESRKETISSWFEWENRNNPNSVVFEWDCLCPEEVDGTSKKYFQDLWETMRLRVKESLDKSPLGKELEKESFWSPNDGLWSFTCCNCRRTLISQGYMVGRVKELFIGESECLPISI